MKNLFVSLSIILFIFACKNKTEQNKKPFSLLNTPVEKFADSVIIDFSAADTILLETNKQSVFNYESAQFKFTSEYIFIFDNNPLFSTQLIKVFNWQGKYIGSIGNIGQGPGEFTSALNFMVDDAKQEVYINTGHKLIVYNYKGDYLRTIKYPSYIGLYSYELPGGGFISFSPHPVNNQLLNKFDFNGKHTDSLFSIPQNYYPYASPICSKNSNRLYVIPLWYDEIYSINDKNQITREFDFNIEDEFLIRHISLNEDNMLSAFLSSDYYGPFQKLHVSDDSIFLTEIRKNRDTYQVFGDLSTRKIRVRELTFETNFNTIVGTYNNKSISYTSLAQFKDVDGNYMYKPDPNHNGCLLLFTIKKSFLNKTE
ncbi:6-bladed beta-propeller [Saccharicrinis sp. FJH2]|uniref:6-bladed beta-propeller n=1 Tax=Saccharicrinis sp. FJH65 TaxID=3344659 RepID=UPI0035F36EAF